MEIQNKINAAIVSRVELPSNIRDLLIAHADVAAAVAAVSPRGKGGKVKTNKPKDPIWAFVWRMARFNAGDDVTMPVCAYWDLSLALRQVWGMSDEDRRANEKFIGEVLDTVSMAACVAMGLDPMGGANRWRKAIYG